MNSPEFAYADEFDANNLKASDTEVVCANQDYYIFWDDRAYPNNQIEQVIIYRHIGIQFQFLIIQ